MTAGCEGCAHGNASLDAPRRVIPVSMLRWTGNTVCFFAATFEPFDVPLFPYDGSQMIGSLVFFTFQMRSSTKASLNSGAAASSVPVLRPGSVFGLKRFARRRRHRGRRRPATAQMLTP